MADYNELLDKISKCVEELQRAEVTVVEALKKLESHNTDPNAHPNWSGEQSIELSRLAEEILALKQRVDDIEEAMTTTS